MGPRGDKPGTGIFLVPSSILEMFKYTILYCVDLPAWDPPRYSRAICGCFDHAYSSWISGLQYWQKKPSTLQLIVLSESWLLWEAVRCVVHTEHL